ncbi:glycosyltransferase family 4 protein [Autumnicola edwardsiae]|uniref:Glycosyltransferase n=1 Tax=Autumnicola edwardsiae TaxID=3075594 RepID=A0ABU3CWU0_9FLAO|nr:glycosyltransferase [Zunongwangia sp. F297]MDT0650827.1 glycosyltransferase [Zunongwangia sp. F297]
MIRRKKLNYSYSIFGASNNSNMRLLIATPFLGDIGGTELETLNTANFLAKTGGFEEIEIFSPSVFDVEKCSPFAVNPIITFSTYPQFFQNMLFRRIEGKIKRTLNLKSPLGENLYWFFRSFKKYSKVYVLTTQSLHYFIPLINNFHSSRIVLKYTMFENTSIPDWMQEILRKVKYNIVMSKMQQNFFYNNFGTTNVVVQDITIGNESKLLEVRTKRNYTFGILCRFSKEKRIEETIKIIDELRALNFHATLLIQGDGHEKYFEFLNQLVLNKNLEGQITLNKRAISPMMTEEFYEQISYFLLTSVYEGGPMTGLEAMAAGIPVLSYNVGAMKERLGEYDWLIANDFQEMVQIAYKLVQLPNIKYREISLDIRRIYKNKLLNKYKIKKLQDLLIN